MAKGVITMLALVVLQLLSLSSQAAEPQEVVQLEADVAILTDGGTAISSVPYTVTSSGLYYLTKELQTTSGSQNAITINADNVTVDLMGYSLIGTGSGTGCGIFMNARKNVEIRNGTVRNFGGSGIYEAKNATQGSTTQGLGHRVIGVRAYSNDANGISLAGIGHLVKDCTSAGNLIGIYAVADSTLTGNITYENLGAGILCETACMVCGNIASDNGFTGILVGEGCNVTDNTACYNNVYIVDLGLLVGDGISVIANGCMIKGNTLKNNGQNNIYVEGTDNAIEENLVTNSVYGIYFKTSGNFYASNRASGNTTNYGGPGKPSSGSSGDGGGNVSF